MSSMVVRYDMTPQTAVAAYWYRWRTKTRFKLRVLAFGGVPAMLAFTFTASALPGHIAFAIAAAVLTEVLSPALFAFVIKKLSQRGQRTLMIDSDGLATEVPSGRWQASWRDVREIAATPEFIFFLGRGINSVSIPVSAFADDDEREEFLRRARRYFASAHRHVQ